MLFRTLLFVYFLLAFLSIAFAQSPVFLEQDGLLVIEMESTVDDLGDWQLDTAVAGFTGSGYLRYTGPNQYSNPGRSTQTFRFQISKPGTYRFQWRSRILQGNSNSEHNDSWLRLPDADDFYGQKNNSKVYPKGTGKTPNPNGSSKDGWFKIYMNQKNTWSWQARTSDHDAHDIFARYDNTGIYTIEISGRSQGHGIDRLVMYHADVSTGEATEETQPESPTSPLSTGLFTPASTSPLRVFPNPARDFIQVEIRETSYLPDEVGFTVLDMHGRSIQTGTHHLQNPFSLDIGALSTGLYVLKFEGEGKRWLGRFQKW